MGGSKVRHTSSIYNNIYGWKHASDLGGDILGCQPVKTTNINTAENRK